MDYIVFLLSTVFFCECSLIFPGLRSVAIGLKDKQAYGTVRVNALLFVAEHYVVTKKKEKAQTKPK